jgi:RND family efflux transporter MFP subunit
MKAYTFSFATSLLVLPVACDNSASGPELPPPTSETGPAAPELPKIEGSKPASAKSMEKRYIGSTYAKERVEIAPERSGTLAEVRFDVGDEVKKGEVVFRLKAQNAKLSLTASKKQLSAARTGLKTAKREYARIKELHDAGAATPAALDSVQSQVEQAEIAVEQAQVAVDMGQTGVGDMRTRSPIAGVVVERFKDPGEAVTSMPLTTVVVIEDQSTLELRFRIPELDLRHIEKGSSLEAYFPALDETRNVTVSRIGSAVDVRTRSIEIIAEVDNSDLRLKPGMSTEVKPVKLEKSAAADETKDETPTKVAKGDAQ